MLEVDTPERATIKEIKNDAWFQKDYTSAGGLGLWDPELWDPELWDPELWDPELWDPELWDPELWDPELWDPELWDPELWDPEFWDPEFWDPGGRIGADGGGIGAGGGGIGAGGAAGGGIGGSELAEVESEDRSWRMWNRSIGAGRGGIGAGGGGIGAGGGENGAGGGGVGAGGGGIGAGGGGIGAGGDGIGVSELAEVESEYRSWWRWNRNWWRWNRRWEMESEVVEMESELADVESELVKVESKYRSWWNRSIGAGGGGIGAGGGGIEVSELVESKYRSWWRWNRSWWRWNRSWWRWNRSIGAGGGGIGAGGGGIGAGVGGIEVSELVEVESELVEVESELVEVESKYRSWQRWNRSIGAGGGGIGADGGGIGAGGGGTGELELTEVESDYRSWWRLVLSPKKMSPPTLFQLAAKSLAQGIHKGLQPVDIVSKLKKAVNTNSCKMIVHLGFSGELFMIGWEEKISKLLPSLQSIKINSMVFNERSQFSNFCNSFPNLRTLDISFAKGLSNLKGMKNLKHLQVLMIRNVEIRDIGGYNELSELKNLRFLDVSSKNRRNSIRVIRSLLESEVRIENLEFLDCSMTSVQEHELRKFVKYHPALNTVVAISTACDYLPIPTINLLNFISIDSILKSLKYAVSNDRVRLAENCMCVISQKLNIGHKRLNDCEISKLLNTLLYVLREAKDGKIKFLVISCFAKSNFFQTGRFFTSYSLEILEIVELIFKSLKNVEYVSVQSTAHPLILTFFNRIVNFMRFGRTLQDRLLSFIMEKTLELSYTSSKHVYMEILIRASRLMSVDQHTALCNNTKVIRELFAIAHKLIKRESSSYQQVIELIVSYLKQASEDTLKFLVSNGQLVENCIEQFMIFSRLPFSGNIHMLSRFPTKDMQKHLLHFLMVFSSVMSDEQLRKCYGGETAFRLMNAINTNGLRNPLRKTKDFCSILSLLLAKNLTEHREYIKMKIREFNDSLHQSSLLDFRQMSGKVLNGRITSKVSTDDSILILLSTVINGEGYEANLFRNFMRATSGGILNNQNMTEYARKAAQAVLYEIGRIENE
ncbi:unnamed protein product [Caenorhabditis nigoni]